MNNEYVIINKTEWLKVMEKLEKSEHLKSKWTHDNDRDKIEIQISLIKQVMSKSTPLIPVVEKAFDAGGAYTLGSHKEFTQTHPSKQDYITNLKLDI